MRIIVSRVELAINYTRFKFVISLINRKNKREYWLCEVRGSTPQFSETAQAKKFAKVINF